MGTSARELAVHHLQHLVGLAVQLVVVVALAFS
jgi:hypothetical protein